MKVILLEELKGRGGEGDVVDVATGYAVNYLFPKKIAIQATKGNLKQLELRKHNIAKREEARLDTADKLLAALEGQRIRIGAKVGEEGQLFGSVTPQQVANALNAKFGLDIDRKRVDLQEVIKRAGEHAASVNIYRDTKANIVIEVVDEKKLAELEKPEVEAVTDETASDEAVADEVAADEAVADEVVEADAVLDAADAEGAEPAELADDAEAAAVEALGDTEPVEDAIEAIVDEPAAADAVEPEAIAEDTAAESTEEGEPEELS